MVTDARRRPRGIATTRELVDLAKSECPGVSDTNADLVHVTTVGWGRRIIDEGVLAKRSCKVFGRDLVYFFLARPAYRFGSGDAKNDQMNFFPFALVLSPEALPLPYHVYPFDTGAYQAGLYDEVVDPSIYLEDYELEPNLASAERHVNWAFGDMDKYFDAIVRQDLAGAIPQWSSVAQCWIRIAGLASSGRERPDRRSSAIEVAYSRSIDLRQRHGRYIVLPEQLLEDPKGSNTVFINKLRALDIDFETYEWRPNETPDSYADIIADVIRRRLPRAA
jgi:hypothetical protein